MARHAKDIISYMPPESFNPASPRASFYDGTKADIYAAGIILFNLLSGYMPYYRTDSENYLFKLFSTDRASFWKYHMTHSFADEPISDDAVDLLNGLLEGDPKKRISLKAIQSHPWIQREVATEHELSTVMKKIKSCADLAKKEPERKLELAKSASAASRMGRIKTHKKKAEEKSLFARFDYEKIGLCMSTVLGSIFGK